MACLACKLKAQHFRKTHISPRAREYWKNVWICHEAVTCPRRPVERVCNPLIHPLLEPSRPVRGPKKLA